MSGTPTSLAPLRSLHTAVCQTCGAKPGTAAPFAWARNHARTHGHEVMANTLYWPGKRDAHAR